MFNFVMSKMNHFAKSPALDPGAYAPGLYAVARSARSSRSDVVGEPIYMITVETATNNHARC